MNFFSDILYNRFIVISFYFLFEKIQVPRSRKVELQTKYIPSLPKNSYFLNYLQKYNIFTQIVLREGYFFTLNLLFILYSQYTKARAVAMAFAYLSYNAICDNLFMPCVSVSSCHMCILFRHASCVFTPSCHVWFSRHATERRLEDWHL